MAGQTNINGNYGVQTESNDTNSYEVPSGSWADTNVSPPEQAPNSAAAGKPQGQPPTQEEIGWFFVEQYYKTLCNEPGKLYLYYNKRSQFVCGDEAEKVQVAVGQKAINDRIKQLDIQDGKVRVLNVDSQESGKNILVQVIGEMSNKAEPHRKFAQTFVLAEQPSGYYVLNDIFRYIVLDEEEFENGGTVPEPIGAEAPAHKQDAAPGVTSVDDPATKAGIEEVDQKLRDTQIHPLESSNSAVAPSAPTAEVEDAPGAAATEEQQAPTEDQVQAAETATAVEQVLPEEPRDPEPTPSRSPPQTSENPSTSSELATEPSKPAPPKTWANLVAANRVAAPAPSPNAPNAPANSNAAKAKPSPSAKESTAPPSSSPGDESPVKAQQNGNAGWQTAGAGNDKRQNRGTSQSVSGQESVLGYVKNVTDKVDASILKEKLNSLGKLLYFDVSRPKNCAFVEFESVAGFQATVNANPLIIGGEHVIVEERRPRANPYGGNFAGRGNMRGSRGGSDNRPNSSGRGNFKDGGRGGYNSRTGRGSTPTARGRTGPAQAA